MRVLILGIGDAFTRKHLGSCALIEAPEGHVLLDCPDSILRALLESTTKVQWDIDVTDIGDILLTHLHGDHCNGLETVGFFRRIQRLENPSLPRPRLHVIQPVADRLWERLAPAMDTPFGGFRDSTLEDFFDVRILRTDAPSTVAGLDIQCRVTGHPVPTVGFVLRDQSATFGWSGDTPFETDHVDWLNQADLIVHESNTGETHTPIENLNDLDESIKKKMWLIHLPDDFDASRTDIGILQQGQILTPERST